MALPSYQTSVTPGDSYKLTIAGSAYTAENVNIAGESEMKDRPNYDGTPGDFKLYRNRMTITADLQPSGSTFPTQFATFTGSAAMGHPSASNTFVIQKLSPVWGVREFAKVSIEAVEVTAGI